MGERFALGGQISTLPATSFRLYRTYLQNDCPRRLPQLLVNAGHLINRAMQHGRQTCALERTEDFLRLA